jgi:hypothetical protein
MSDEIPDGLTMILIGVLLVCVLFTAVAAVGAVLTS